MAYERGGKVWVDEKNLGWVFLEEDWKDDRLPEDLVEEAGLLGVEFRLANSLERAELGGYARMKTGGFSICLLIPLNIMGLEMKRFIYFVN